MPISPGYTSRVTVFLLLHKSSKRCLEKTLFLFFRNFYFFNYFFWHHCLNLSMLAVSQDNFESNWPRDMILVSIPMFLGTRNLMELFSKASGQQYCQFCTTGLPENVILAVLQHNFESNWPRAMILVSIPIFSGTSNRMELFSKASGQQNCQFCTTGLPESYFSIFYKPVMGGDSYIPLEHMLDIFLFWEINMV